MIKKIFFAVIFLGFLGSILFKDVSFSAYENRFLASAPAFSLSSVYQGNFMRDFDSYVSDQMIARSSLIFTKNLWDQKFFRQNAIREVYLGKNNYLINRYTESSIDTDLLTKNIEFLEQFQEKYQAQVILIPTASEVLTQQLPSFSSHIKIGDYCKDATVTLDALAILSSHKEEAIFYKTDHHWTLLGAYYLYSAFVDTPIPYKTEPVTRDFLGSTYKKLPLPATPDAIFRIKSPDTFQVTYDNERVTNSLYEEKALGTLDQYSYYLDGNHALTKIENQSLTTSDSIVIIKDSFANTFATLLAHHYKYVYLVDLRYYNGGLEELITSPNPTEILFLYQNAQFVQDKSLVKLVY